MVFRKKYIREGEWDSTRMYLRRMHKNEVEYARRLFKSEGKISFSEVLFHPELRFSKPGQKGSFLGGIDSKLSSQMGFLSIFARQVCLKLYKN